MRILKNQQGMASIMFAMFMVALISLLVVGLTSIAVTDQRQTLDKSLSNQAQYAAETAINRQATILAATPSTPAQLTCTSLSAAEAHVLVAELPDVTITCLKWLTNLPNIVLNNVGVAGPVATPVKFSAATSSMDISWNEASGAALSAYAATNLNLLNGYMPTLRLTIAAANNVSAATTIYLSPRGIGGPTTISAAADGSVGAAACSGAPLTCTVTITSLPGGGTDYYASISSLNGTSTVTIASASPGVTVSGAQVEIDATAKSQDVIKRLTARKSLVPTTWRPGFAAEAGALCKNFKLDGGGPASNTLPGPAYGTACSN